MRASGLYPVHRLSGFRLKEAAEIFQIPSGNSPFVIYLRMVCTEYKYKPVRIFRNKVYLIIPKTAGSNPGAGDKLRFSKNHTRFLCTGQHPPVGNIAIDPVLEKQNGQKRKGNRQSKNRTRAELERKASVQNNNISAKATTHHPNTCDRRLFFLRTVLRSALAIARVALQSYCVSQENSMLLFSPFQPAFPSPSYHTRKGPCNIKKPTAGGFPLPAPVLQNHRQSATIKEKYSAWSPHAGKKGKLPWNYGFWRSETSAVQAD